MTSKIFSVAIIGGGPTGSALALLLSRVCKSPEQIALIQSDQATRYGLEPQQDPRVLAVNHGSRVLLETLNGWPTECAEIETIHVSQKGRLGRAIIKKEDFNVPQLGCVVRYAALHAKLAQATQDRGIAIIKTLASDVKQVEDGVEIQCADQTIHAQIVVQADGQVQGQATRRYEQAAIIAYAYATQPKKGWAYERFTREGPLAVLPHPQNAHMQSVVWCCAPERAEKLKSLSPQAFSIALSRMFGTRLGFLTVNQPVNVFPLTLNMTSTLVQGRRVSIGNAAQTLHPVAGQGLNLGLRDAATLANCLAAWLSGTATSPDAGLARFEPERTMDRQITVRLTDVMSRFFTTSNPLMHHAAGLALLGMDVIPGLRTPLTRHLLQGLRR